MCIVTVFVCNICTPWHKDSKILGISNLFWAIDVTFFSSKTFRAEIVGLGNRVELRLAESVELCGKEAINRRNDGRNKLRRGRPYATHLDQQLHREVVDRNRAGNRDCIAPQLSSTRCGRGVECDVTIEPETRKKGYREDHDKRCDMGRNHNASEVDKSLADDEVIDHEIPYRIECHIGRAADSVAP